MNNIAEHKALEAYSMNENTEFEKALLAAFNYVAGKAVMTIGPATFQDDVDEWKQPLLDIARKELKGWRYLLRRYKDGYEQGKLDMKKQMMKDTVEGIVKYEIGSAEIPQCDKRYQVLSDPAPIANAKLGDKVKIIIVKEV